MKYPETFAYFYFRGFDCSPDKIGEVLSLNASESWNVGDSWTIGDPNRKRKESCWKFNATQIIDGDFSSNVHMAYLLEILEQRESKLRDLPRGCGIGLTYVVTRYHNNIYIELTPSMIQRAAALALRIDYDVYALGDAE